jgi:acyl transferase domain-containing protein
MQGVAHPELPARFGAFIPDAAAFDAQLFGVSPSEAALMDPQQRLLLHAVLRARPATLSAAGVAPAAGSPITGVFVGVGGTDYQSLCDRAGVAVGPFSFTSSSAGTLAGRVAYMFGLHGPAASVDTACSASLVGLHLAVTAVQGGQCGRAVSAGVMLACTPQGHAMVQRAGMMAAEGRCKALDAAADGYVRAEGCCALWLGGAPSVGRQDADKRAPIGVLASGVNSNGRASSLTAPHGPSQQALLAGVLGAAGLSAAALLGLQLHSNGEYSVVSAVLPHMQQ